MQRLYILVSIVLEILQNSSGCNLFRVFIGVPSCDILVLFSVRQISFHWTKRCEEVYFRPSIPVHTRRHSRHSFIAIKVQKTILKGIQIETR